MMTWPKCDTCKNPLIVTDTESYCPVCNPDNLKPKETPTLGVSVSETIVIEDKMGE